MNYSELKTYDTANGPGVRVSLFVSGCRHHCPNCFNEIAWDFSHGKPFTKDVEDAIINRLNQSFISGITLLGGEPLEPENQSALLPFIRRVRRECPGKTVWCYTGFIYRKSIPGEGTPDTEELLSLFDVLVDGPFIQAEHHLGLRFRGSANQRLIDIKKSAETIVTLES